MEKSAFNDVEQNSTHMAFVLKELMAEMCLSAQDVSNKTGIMQQQISRYMNGQMPQKATIERIANGLGIPVERLCPPDGTQIFVCPHCGHRYVIKEATDNLHTKRHK